MSCIKSCSKALTFSPVFITVKTPVVFSSRPQPTQKSVLWPEHGQITLPLCFVPSSKLRDTDVLRQVKAQGSGKAETGCGFGVPLVGQISKALLAGDPSNIRVQLLQGAPRCAAPKNWICSCLDTELCKAWVGAAAAAVEMSHELPQLLLLLRHTGLAPGAAPWVGINAVPCTCPPGAPELADLPLSICKNSEQWNHSVSRTWISLCRM